MTAENTFSITLHYLTNTGFNEAAADDRGKPTE